VFFDWQARISLLGEAGRATLVDNLRRRGAEIAGFLNVLFGSRIDLCRDFTKSSYIGTFRKIGNPSFHQVSPTLSISVGMEEEDKTFLS
jgi:hypothetical protein